MIKRLFFKERPPWHKSPVQRLAVSLRRNWDLYLLFLPVIAYYVIFHYVPMYGIQIAFKNFNAALGIWGSKWAGLEHFQRFFSGYFIGRLIFNTITLSLYGLAVGFFMPIVLALMLNEARNIVFRRTVQTVTYAPYFLSTVVMVGMLIAILSPNNGLINNIIRLFGGTPVNFMTEPDWFKSLYVFSGVWQNTGYESIIFLAALAGINPELHEAAQIDGASRLRRIWHINLPGILPTIVIMFILACGRIMSVGFEKVFLMQNAANQPSSDVISTYVYRVGVLGAQYSFSTAVGMFNSIVNFIMLAIANQVSKRATETSFW
jgi:putative aldouronate transport system permease protein